MKVFISYSHKDVSQVEMLVALLRKIDVEPWFDDKIMGGDEWKTRILRTVRECDVLVFVISSHSIQSEWCLRELEEAQLQNKRVIPILLEKVATLPPALEPYQYIDFSQRVDEITTAKLTASLYKLREAIKSDQYQAGFENTSHTRGNITFELRNLAGCTARMQVVFTVLLLFGVIIGFSGNAALEGTAGDNRDDNGDVARVGDPRVLYQVTVEDMEAYLLENLDGANGLYDLISSQLQEFKAVAEKEAFYAVLSDSNEVRQIDQIMKYAYAKLSDSEIGSIEELQQVETDDGEFELQVIIGEWADPYGVEGASLQFYLKVPEEISRDLPKEWHTLDKPLDTHIFWTSLRGIPALEGQR